MTIASLIACRLCKDVLGNRLQAAGVSALSGMPFSEQVQLVSFA